MMHRSVRRWLTLVAASGVLAIALTGCGHEVGGDFAGPGRPSSSAIASPSSEASTSTCRNAELSADNAAGTRYPKTINSRCIRSEPFDDYAQVGNTLVTMVFANRGNYDHPGSIQLRALDLKTGAQRWVSERIPASSSPQQSGKPFERSAFPENGSAGHPLSRLPVLHHGSKTYVALLTTYVQPATAVDSEQDLGEARFYDVAATGTVTKPTTFRVSDPSYRPYQQFQQHELGDQLLYQKDSDENAFEIVDPSTGKGAQFTHHAAYATGFLESETVLAATENGDVVVSYSLQSSESGQRVGLYHADGSKAWSAEDHPPSGADPGSNEFIGVYGDQIVTTWRVGDTGMDDTARYQRPYELALHNSKTGEVVATSHQVTPTDMLSSAAYQLSDHIVRTGGERYLLVGTFVFDLAKHKELPSLPAALHIDTVSTEGVAYGAGNENRYVAYDIPVKKVLYDDPSELAQPIAVTDSVAAFSLTIRGANYLVIHRLRY